MLNRSTPCFWQLTRAWCQVRTDWVFLRYNTPVTGSLSLPSEAVEGEEDGETELSANQYKNHTNSCFTFRLPGSSYTSCEAVSRQRKDCVPVKLRENSVVSTALKMRGNMFLQYVQGVRDQTQSALTSTTSDNVTVN